MQKRPPIISFAGGANGRQMESYHLCINGGATDIEPAVTLVKTVYLAAPKQPTHGEA